MARPLVPVLCLVALVAVACGDEEPERVASTTTTADSEASAAGGGCPEVEQPAAREDGGASRPGKGLDQDRRYHLVLDTSCGEIDILLDQRTSPKTTASVAALARSGFYDDTAFHRIVPGFVIQGGDPTGTGIGGPGYSTRDTPPSDTTYLKGTVAMAKTQTEPPGTAGSQFYIVSGPDAGLPPDYAVIGKVAKGLDVVARIGRLGDPASGGAGTPLQPVVIEEASIRGD
jgi:peptidyl-prolyl cis-trans isomerase B (cyclophilin B)